MPVKSDIEIIEAAYEGTISQLYSIFFESMSAAHSEETKKHAEEGFRRGVHQARKVRDRALQLI